MRSRREGKREFLEAVERDVRRGMLPAARSPSWASGRSRTFMLWRIGYDLDAFEEMTSALMKRARQIPAR
jgi:hypothetical protein